MILPSSKFMFDSCCDVQQNLAEHPFIVLTKCLSSLNPVVPPRHGTDLCGQPWKGNGPLPGFYIPKTATLLSLGCQSNLGQGMEQNTLISLLCLGC